MLKSPHIITLSKLFKFWILFNKISKSFNWSEVGNGGIYTEPNNIFWDFKIIWIKTQSNNFEFKLLTKTVLNVFNTPIITPPLCVLLSHLYIWYELLIKLSGTVLFKNVSQPINTSIFSSIK